MNDDFSGTYNDFELMIIIPFHTHHDHFWIQTMNISFRMHKELTISRFQAHPTYLAFRYMISILLAIEFQKLDILARKALCVRHISSQITKFNFDSFIFSQSYDVPHVYYISFKSQWSTSDLFMMITQQIVRKHLGFAHNNNPHKSRGSTSDLFMMITLQITPITPANREEAPRICSWW